MTPELIADMDAAMDDMGDFMHTTPAPFPTIEHAVGLPACRPSKLYTTNGLVTARSRGISIPTRADYDHNRAIRGR
jgi:hypothetical protein